MARSREWMPRRWLPLALALPAACITGLLLAGGASGFGYLTEWGRCDIRPGEKLSGASSIAVPSDGRFVYVAEGSGGRRVHAFTPSGRVLATLKSPYDSGLDEVNLGPAPGGGVYVAYAGQSLRPEVRRFSFTRDFAQAAAWGPGGSSSGFFFRYPAAVLGGGLSGGQSSLDVAFVLDRFTPGYGGLLIFDSSGNGLGSDLGAQRPEDGIDGGVALTGISGAPGNVIVAESPFGGAAQVAYFSIVPDRNSRFLTTKLVRRWPVGGRPVGIAYTRGALWVAVTRSSADGNGVEVYTPAGARLREVGEGEVPGGLAGLNGIAADAAGNVYLSDGTRVIKLGDGGGLPKSGGGSSSPYAEVCGPEIEVRARSPQRVLRQGGVVLRAVSDDRARLVASATVSVPGARVHRLRGIRRSARSNRRTKLTLKLTKRARQAIRGSFARKPRGRLKARIRVRATDPARLTSVTRGTVYLRR